jgi:hypothetical protein
MIRELFNCCSAASFHVDIAAFIRCCHMRAFMLARHQQSCLLGVTTQMDQQVEVEEIGAGRKKSSKRGSGSSTAAAASTAESSKPSGPCNIVITEVPYQTSKVGTF